jgi:hypothetical protein
MRRVRRMRMADRVAELFWETLDGLFNEPEWRRRIEEMTEPELDRYLEMLRTQLRLRRHLAEVFGRRSRDEVVRFRRAVEAESPRLR